MTTLEFSRIQSLNPSLENSSNKTGLSDDTTLSGNTTLSRIFNLLEKGGLDLVIDFIRKNPIILSGIKHSTEPNGDFKKFSLDNSEIKTFKGFLDNTIKMFIHIEIEDKNGEIHKLKFFGEDLKELVKRANTLNRLQSGKFIKEK